MSVFESVTIVFFFTTHRIRLHFYQWYLFHSITWVYPSGTNRSHIWTSTFTKCIVLYNTSHVWTSTFTNRTNKLIPDLQLQFKCNLMISFDNTSLLINSIKNIIKNLSSEHLKKQLEHFTPNSSPLLILINSWKPKSYEIKQLILAVPSFLYLHTLQAAISPWLQTLYLPPDLSCQNTICTAFLGRECLSWQNLWVPCWLILLDLELSMNFGYHIRL